MTFTSAPCIQFSYHRKRPNTQAGPQKSICTTWFENNILFTPPETPQCYARDEKGLVALNALMQAGDLDEIVHQHAPANTEQKNLMADPFAMQIMHRVAGFPMPQIGPQIFIGGLFLFDQYCKMEDGLKRYLKIKKDQNMPVYIQTRDGIVEEFALQKGDVLYARQPNGLYALQHCEDPHAAFLFKPSPLAPELSRN